MKSQSIIAFILALALPMTVVGENSTVKNWSKDNVLDVDSDEYCEYRHSLGIPCCRDVEIVYIDGFTKYALLEDGSYYACGFAFPDEEVKEDEMFGDYPYCNGCETNYTDKDGSWNFIDETWCKVSEKKCFKICEPIKGYQCCKDSSTEVISKDNDGSWGIENKKWCLIQTIPEFNDFEINASCTMDGSGINKLLKYVQFIFSYEENVNFEEKYEIVSILLNDNPVNLDNITYFSKYFRFYTSNYLETNEIKMILRDKTTKQKYYKTFITGVYRMFF
ncbi:hypothetical protein BCR32DRAFT_247469 [Anaeromyces robustus]|uniref:CBM10 domain-containing protein n=1 Tax=Anaeromyces robustus TaxID=1754192 RepID=A0A1Y1WWX9_9FUNG|nr:hypothetical protein BCR32DRAFT_247469 [Anaeromyces robustus]|eukprot:ORX78047.1 hypothetical protein BCR32DRAFT_247469 [Anaeromyces robustus]